MLRMISIGIALMMIIVGVFRINSLLHPISIRTANEKLEIVDRQFKMDDRVKKAILLVAEIENIDPLFITSLMFTESTFHPNVISPKGYQGLMQIPYYVPYMDINTLIGVRIFKQKLKLADGDMVKALCWYKGWKITDAEGIKQARKVIRLYRLLLKELEDNRYES